jgi:hypothetical protein
MGEKRRKLSEAKLAAMAAATNARHPGKLPAANEHWDQPAAAAKKRGIKRGSTPKTELQLLESATSTPSMPRKRKSPAEFSPLGRASQAGKQGGSCSYCSQIEGSGSKQDIVSAVQGRMESIADQLGPGDARLVQAIASCMGDSGGAVVQQLMGVLARERADEAEERTAEFQAQIEDFRFHSAQRYRR